MKRPSWHKHPNVRSGDELTIGEKAADRMKATLATWPAFLAVAAGMTAWIVTRGAGVDAFPFILLNLALSAFAACQCFVLLIAAKRGERIAYEVAMSTHRQVQDIAEVLQRAVREIELVDQKLTLMETPTRMRGRRGW